MFVNIWTAASDGDIESVRAFLADGGDINAKDENGYTPLQAAVSYSHMELVKLLLANGADVKLGEFTIPLFKMFSCEFTLVVAGDNEMDTPLHRSETVECATVLLDHGADMNARNLEGQTPYDVAIEDEHEELQALYKSLGADRSNRILKSESEIMPDDPYLKDDVFKLDV
ncbi:hypothetical protein CCR75_001426 [Bremia lactucae]|uniref:Uncharacterized protein n=1 Tax=Bremia lactucae TaxID=4779 RepID=A0A976FKI5_BRELC|nr:hypothetical protein CCR75_001426 [Bremia lactucae]